jgi:hypothetical protein
MYPASARGSRTGNDESREGARNLPGSEQERSKTPAIRAKQLRELFGKVAEATTGQPTPYLAAKRKKRDETRRGFKLARRLTVKVARSLLYFMHLPSPHDREQERIEAERFLRMLIDEWTDEGHGHGQDGNFHYAATSDFDPHP